MSNHTKRNKYRPKSSRRFVSVARRAVNLDERKKS